MKGDRLGEFEEFTLLAVRALGDHTYAVPVQQFVEEATGAMSRSARSTPRWRGSRTRASCDRRWGMRRRGAAASPKRLFEVTPLGLRTARELHRVREKIWNTIAEGPRS